MIKKEFKTITEIADEIFDNLKRISNPFETPILVFHNIKIAQWFKAYYLKQHDEVLMNVRFITLTMFISSLINPKGEHKIISGSEVRDYIVKALLNKCVYDTTDSGKPTNYIYNDDGSINGTNLYEFADRLSSLFLNYEYDSEEMESWTDGKWEKDIYDETIKLAKADNCYTTKSLFDLIKGTDEFKKLDDKVYIIDNSYITNLYNDILDCFDVNVFSIKNEETDFECEEIINAPSLLREVEAVHSKICKIIYDNSVRINDIMVYVPKMDDYVNAINQVFKQDDEEYPSIPYRIVGASKEQQDMISSLNVLNKIAINGFVTRNDFRLFVKNPMIKKIRQISDEEFLSWMNAIELTNTYRNGKKENDWDYLKKRLLLSKLISNDSDLDKKTSVGADDNCYLPFQLIGLDFESINKLIDIIDALLNWSNGFGGDLNNITLDKKDILAKKELLDALYSMKGEDGEESNVLYRTVLEENERIMALDIAIPANTWFKMLLDSPNRYISHPADMFVNGVTFIALTSDNVVAEPYVFVMGLNSKSYPRKSLKGELDYSKKHIASEKLDEKAIKNVCSGAKHCVCSFVGYDLVKDAEAYPSKLMPKISDSKSITKIPLDEVRDYSMLFTRKTFTNKEYYLSLVKNGSDLPSKSVKRLIDKSIQNIDSALKITDISNYLDNTFVYKYNRLLQINNEIDGVFEDEYEPIDSNALTKQIVVNELIKSTATEEEQLNNTKLTKVLPEREIGELYFDEYKKAADVVKNNINEGYKPKALKPLELNTVKGGDTIKWTLSCNTDMYVKENGNDLFYIEPNDGLEKIKHYYNAYVYSLADIVQNHNDGNSYNVKLNGENGKEYKATAAEAVEILGKLYDQMTDYKDTRYMDSEILMKIYENLDPSKMPRNKIPNTFQGFLSTIENDTKWKYFKDKKMIDVYQAFGYSNNIENELQKMAEETILPCVKFLDRR